MKLEGSFTALVTPFADGKLDLGSLRGMLRFQLRSRTAGVVPCGSTGEAATLSAEEYRQVVSLAVSECRGRIPVIPGIGTNSTERAVAAAREAEGLGADALLVLVPYYNKPTQEGMFRHFQAAARAVRIPVVVYNIPGRTGVNLQPATLARLAKACRNITATKEAAGSLDQVSEILCRCPKGFTVLSGDDSLTVPMMSVGARGVISVVANILPKESAAMCAAALRGDFAAARRWHLRLFPVIKALFMETNPIPVKAAAELAGLCRGEPRLPLTPLSAENRRSLAAAFRGAGFRL
ncbi:MAG: 4-hydroxy-tetrahydrodipicolinate synthase [Elusimicrobia bacterium GWA2_69_24]|nr:MAG: 4-hydroxy-tetrahydrodipicolinate synthase [Elusimicrobia bacterium GWA2_69_24]HBL18134.1 4-hydroxy-tetrahydrodipicolinate synthase [Elusimicrobiota bacterium]